MYYQGLLRIYSLSPILNYVFRSCASIYLQLSTWNHEKRSLITQLVWYSILSIQYTQPLMWSYLILGVRPSMQSVINSPYSVLLKTDVEPIACDNEEWWSQARIDQDMLKESPQKKRMRYHLHNLSLDSIIHMWWKHFFWFMCGLSCRWLRQPPLKCSDEPAASDREPQSCSLQSPTAHSAAKQKVRIWKKEIPKKPSSNVSFPPPFFNDLFSRVIPADIEISNNLSY